MFDSFKRLNIGCGMNRIDDAWNVDVHAGETVDEIWDCTTSAPNCWIGHFEQALCFHCIEHISKPFQPAFWDNIWKVLCVDGTAIITYPEFLRCVERYRNNYKGMREFWEATIYGRQLYPGDFHVTIMDTPLILPKLKGAGFELIETKPEPDEPHNQILYIRKIQRPLNYEQTFKKEIFT